MMVYNTFQDRMRRKNPEGAPVVGQWFIGVIAYLFTSKSGGQTGVTLGVVIGVPVMIIPDTAKQLAGGPRIIAGTPHAITAATNAPSAAK
jgi:hypothetical protein